MNKNIWIVVVVVALILFLGAGLFGNWGYGGERGMMGSGYGGEWGMMGGGEVSPFGWIGMGFMWLVPVGLLVLTVLGIVWLVRSIGGGNNPAATGQTCPSCGRNIQADWKNCPHCGVTLTIP